MKDTTIGFKGSTDLKEKIDQMISVSGLTNKDWFQNLVSLYELQQLKQNDYIKRYEGDVKLLEEHLARIQDVFSSLLKKIIDDHKNLDNQRTKEIDSKDWELQQILIQNTSMNDELSQIKEQIYKETEEKSKINDQLKNMTDLSNSRKEQVETLKKQIIQLEQFKKEAEEINSKYQISKLTKEIEKLNGEVREFKLHCDLEKQTLINEHQKQIIELQQQYTKKRPGPKKNTGSNSNAQKNEELP